jgi:hypothetical protein
MKWLLLLTLGSTSVSTHTWIAEVKANRASHRGGEVGVEGIVVDIRSTSSAAKRGLYRLIDESDREGVLVRTNKLPSDGGSFRLRARVALQQPVTGALLLEEIARTRIDSRPILPVVVGGASVLMLVVLGVLLAKARGQERLYMVSPPLWLLPDAGPYGKSGSAPGAGQPPLQYRPDLEEADRRQRARLKQRTRSLMQALVASLVLTGTSAAWVVETGPISAQVPAFIFIDADDSVAPTPAAPSADTALEDQAPVVRLDSFAERRQFRRDSTVRSRASRLAAADQTPGAEVPAPATRQPVVDSGRVPDISLPTPPPAPAPAPPSPPEVKEPIPDPAVERTRAVEALAVAARRLVSAINDKRLVDLAVVLPDVMAGDLGRRERFLKLVRELGPRAVLTESGDATLAEERGEAKFTILFNWRGDFGVDRRKAGHFLAVVRRQAGGWHFEGARLLDAVP